MCSPQRPHMVCACPWSWQASVEHTPGAQDGVILYSGAHLAISGHMTRSYLSCSLGPRSEAAGPYEDCRAAFSRLPGLPMATLELQGVSDTMPVLARRLGDRCKGDWSFCRPAGPWLLCSSSWAQTHELLTAPHLAIHNFHHGKQAAGEPRRDRPQGVLGDEP